jgi:hypothetical protein
MTTPPPLALRPREAAKALSISERLLWSLTTPRGPIPRRRVGGGKRQAVLYSVDDLRSWLSQPASGNDGGPGNA